MKKRVILRLGVLSLLVFCACNKKGTTKGTLEATTTDSSIESEEALEESFSEDVLENTEPEVRDESDDSIIEAFRGEWWDMTSQRCRMNISYVDHHYEMNIRWTQEDGSEKVWNLTGYYDATFVAISYTGSLSIEKHAEDGTVVSESVYEDGSGIVYMTDEVIYCSDFKEEVLNDCIFHKAE